MPEGAYDYVIIGSGAGGGTLAARLAEAHKRVLLLEAGSDARKVASDGLPQNYDVPAFHPFASEDPEISWNYFVDHYGDRELARRDVKWRSGMYGRACGGDGVLYPRASALGGCTSHNAMIFVRPDDRDWDGIAALTGDDSWSAGRMRRHFQRLENCQHRPVWRWLRWLGLNPTGHGWGGWLHAERAMPLSVMTDPRLVRVLLESVHAELGIEGDLSASLEKLFERHGDPNDVRCALGTAGGLCYTPTSTRGFQRMGARERVLSVWEKHRDYLHIELNALATRVVLDENKRAVAVEYLKGERLYGAHTSPSQSMGEARSVSVRGEVILSGGAFSTPQLLMLSGIGDRVALERLDIPVLVDLPEVGRNLQDRYEVGVVNRMAQPWEAMRGATFRRGDAPYEMWARCRGGLYSSNGSALAVIARSMAGARPTEFGHAAQAEIERAVQAGAGGAMQAGMGGAEREPPDLFCMALLARFEGYFPGYSQLIREHPDYLTWCILKAHTKNRGAVTLRSKNPRDMPVINFNHFQGEGAEEDLRAVVEGIRMARRLSKRLRDEKVIADETLPGKQYESEDQLKEFVRTNAWGHHASCSCAIGPVLNSRFEVHGTRGLRVVDASVFPRIPGFFVASAVYMVAEKAAEVLLASA